eukprot:TRINITY_DN1426_c0_g2_i2.p1 TRINITY_DN1426_c0_g2~~TRINITY_DN1426_c0_g2_i2.p1  ORF type:complete len:1560 (+),score=299.45 TRINITY_DN1426_c0_g2_i2:80-4759(+)
MPSAAETRNTFVTRALEQISHQCGSQKKWSQVKASSLYVLKYLKDPSNQQASPGTVLSLSFVPLRLAVESKACKIIEIALGCLQKLMEYSCIPGDMKWSPPKLDGTESWMKAVKERHDKLKSNNPDDESNLLISQIVTTISDVSSNFTHDGVQLQMIKALLTSVSSPGCDIHGSTLKMAVRNTYNIYILATNVTNQTTAKASLKHMVNIVFQRMESVKQVVSPTFVSSTPPGTPVRIGNSSIASTSGIALTNRSLSESSQVVVEDDLWLKEMVKVIVDKALVEVSAEEAQTDEDILNQDEDPTLDSKKESFDFNRALAERLATAAKKQPVGTAPVPVLAQRGSSKNVLHNVDDAHVADKLSFPSRFHKDAYLLFWSFCKLSDKQVPDTAQEDSIELKSKMLSLELLYNLLSKSGPTFQSSENFIRVVKRNLCLSLLQNCVSPVTSVFKISLHIFLALIQNFKEHLKREIGVFFTNVFFVILESSNSSTSQKMLVIHVIFKICDTPQTLVDIFVNYDCDLESINIFEVIVNNLSRILKARSSSNSIELLKQEQDMRLHALRALVTILRSIVLWTEKFDEAATPQVKSSTDAAEDEPSPFQATEVGDQLTTEEDDDEVEKALAFKKEMRELMSLFKKNPKKGMELFWANKVVEKDAKKTAQFFRETPGLSKIAIGEYLGVIKPFNQEVLAHFVESFDFANLEIDEAVRLFLGAFKINGEASVIDNTMEKFAEMFTKANQQAFPNASTAYVLSFSIIMLHTDAHSAHIKDKMTKEEFMRNNKGIDEGKSLPEQMLSDIYDRVTSTPFMLQGGDKEDELEPANKKDKKKTGVMVNLVDVFSSDDKKRAANYVAESRAMLQKTKELIVSKNDDRSNHFFHASKLGSVKPMFERGWEAMLPAFSVLLEQCGSDQQPIIDLCLEGFKRGVHISCLFFLDVQRDAFVSALSKLTFLNNYREIEHKNIKSIRVLIDIATTEGNRLRSSWYAVLRCISQLEKLQLLGAGAKPDFAFLEVEKTNAGHKVSRDEKSRMKQLEVLNSMTVANQIDEVAISRIYSSTAELSSEAIVYFVKHLCEVSMEEIEHSSPPRMFSLQKIIEIADINMGRIRFVWGQLWEHITKHFCRIGTNENLSVSMFGIDSLRQLATKFLEKRELANYNFQRDFLKPFEQIFQGTNSIIIKELIVRCITQMVHGKSPQIKSGWKAICTVLSLAAGDQTEQIIVLAYDVVGHIMDNIFGLVVAADAFIDAVNTLTAFACNQLCKSIASQAINQLTQCADYLVNGLVIEGTEPEEQKKIFIIPQTETVCSSDQRALKVWFPVLTGLSSDATQHPDVEIRLLALNGLFDVLKKHGGLFSTAMWKIILSGAVFPIFDNALCDVTPPACSASSDSEAKKSSLIINVGLTYTVDLFSQFYTALQPHLSEVLSIVINSVVKATPQGVFDHGLVSLVDLICNHNVNTNRSDFYALIFGEDRKREVETESSSKFGEEDWEIVSSRISSGFSKLAASEEKGFAPRLQKLIQVQGMVIRRFSHLWEQKVLISMLVCEEPRRGCYLGRRLKTVTAGLI